jgi:tRNA A22 N-methylase
VPSKKLSARLSAIAECVNPEVKVFWDIGCDHGQLGKNFLIKSHVNFVDVVESIMTKLEQNLKKHNAQSYTLHLKSGSEVELLNQADESVIIAGMGGFKAIEILNGILKQNTLYQSEFVISVHRDQGEIVNFMAGRGFQTYKNLTVFDRDIFYSVLVFRPLLM